MAPILFNAYKTTKTFGMLGRLIDTISPCLTPDLLKIFAHAFISFNKSLYKHFLPIYS